MKCVTYLFSHIFISQSKLAQYCLVLVVSNLSFHCVLLLSMFHDSSELPFILVKISFTNSLPDNWRDSWREDQTNTP